MSTQSRLILAVDLGGTTLRAALFDREGALLRREACPTESDKGRDSVIEKMTGLIGEVMPQDGTVVALGVSVPGPVDPKTGVIFTPPNLPGWRNVPLEQILHDEFDIPVFVGNDANLAALGEHSFGAGQGVDDLIYITVGTGVGGGVVLGGRLFLGADGLAGEIGHMTIVDDGPRCNCGNVGCLEMLVSGPAIARKAQELMALGEATALHQLVAEAEVGTVTSEMVERAPKNGDLVSNRILSEAGEHLGVAVLNLVHIFNPGLVVIGGGVSRIGEHLFDPVRRVVMERAMPDFIKELRIVPADLSDDAALYGAVALVLQELSGI